NNGRIIDASLGYFINPIFNVALGVLFLGEKMSRRLWRALAIATAGVAWLWFAAGTPPWIALILASTFALYGLIRNVTPLDPLRGSQMESLMMIIPIATFALFSSPHFRWPNYEMTEWSLLLLAGPVTGLPLIWFSEAAQIVPLNLMGFVQYISPSIQFLIGW